MASTASLRHQPPAPAGPTPTVAAPSTASQPSYADAVREGAARAVVATGLGGLVAIHVVDAVGKWTETRYLFWMYVAACVGAIVAAGWTLFSTSRLSLLAAAAVAGSVLAGFLVDRTLGMPNATDDIGNWTEPLGLTSMVVEAATVLVALAAAATVRRPR